MLEQLASFQKIKQRVKESWPLFQEKRKLRLKQIERDGGGSEKIAEGILEDLFTVVLDWNLSDINYQIQYADMLLTSNSIKQLIIEAKHPNHFSINIMNNIDRTLEQAMRYAQQQSVNKIAISDGTMLFAADIEYGALKERVYISLDGDFREELFELWWISLHGIYRKRENYIPKLKRNFEETNIEQSNDLYLHPKYKVSASCFAYVGDPNRSTSWKLPYLLQNGTPDPKRLPKAISAVTANYRGVKVKDIPEQAIIGVLKRLAEAAEKLGKMPQQNPKTTDCYKQLAEVLEQYK